MCIPFAEAELVASPLIIKICYIGAKCKFDHLKYVFEQLPLADTPDKLQQLLPVYASEHLPKMPSKAVTQMASKQSTP